MREPEAWTTFNTQSMLGGALLGRKDYAGAEPLWRGYDGSKRQAGKIRAQEPGPLAEALDRLIPPATATGKADQAKAWIAEKAALPGAHSPIPEVDK